MNGGVGRHLAKGLYGVKKIWLNHDCGTVVFLVDLHPMLSRVWSRRHLEHCIVLWTFDLKRFILAVHDPPSYRNKGISRSSKHSWARTELEPTIMGKTLDVHFIYRGWPLFLT